MGPGEHGRLPGPRVPALTVGLAVGTPVSYATRLRSLRSERPGAPMVSCGTSSCTREEFDRRADALALELRRCGWGWATW
jgi:hypothetical protein